MKMKILITSLILFSIFTMCVSGFEGDEENPLIDANGNYYVINEENKINKYNSSNFSDSFLIGSFETILDNELTIIKLNEANDILFISGHTNKICSVNTIDMTENWNYEKKNVVFHNIIIDSNDNLYTYFTNDEDGSFIKFDLEGTKEWEIKTVPDISINGLTDDENYLSVIRSQEIQLISVVDGVLYYGNTNPNNLTDEELEVLEEAEEEKIELLEEIKNEAYSVIYLNDIDEINDEIKTTQTSSLSSHEVSVINRIANEKNIIIVFILTIICSGIFIIKNKKKN